MPTPTPAPPQFFVYIVESPSSVDIYHGRSEGSLIASALALSGTPCETRTTIDTAAFEAALKIGLPEAMQRHPGRLPIVHLSAHGGSAGLQLSNGTVIAWHELREYVLPINVSLNGSLLLCMSACEGYRACAMAMKHGAPHPYFALVANFGSPTWSDTAVAYSGFYHRLQKGASLPDCVSAMQAASGDMKWLIETAEEAQQYFLKAVSATSTLPEAQEQLEAQAQSSSVSAEAKALESAG